MRHLLLITLLIVSNSTFAQNSIEEGMIYFEEINYTNGPTTNTYVHIHGLDFDYDNGDTQQYTYQNKFVYKVVGRKVYRVVRGRNSNEESRSVLLYDFGLEVGDTSKGDSKGYSFGSYDCGSTKYVLDSIKYLRYGNDTTLRLTQYVRTLGQGYGWYTLIEGIGSLRKGLEYSVHYGFAYGGIKAICWNGVMISNTCNLDSLRSLDVSNLVNQSVKLYPNPVKDKLKISLLNSNILESLQFSISNSLGIKFNDGILYNNSIDVQLLPKGTYILRLAGDNGLFIKPFIKQ